MTPVRTLFISALFLLILLAAFTWLSPHMAAQVPVHWNAQGQVNGYMSPLHAVATPMLLLVLLAAVTVLLPAISPRGYEIQAFISAYLLIMLAVQAFVLVAALAVLMNAAGHSVQTPWVCTLGVGVLLMIVGNYMSKLRKNFFIGIRTPWTLASDAVWERTHRMGGRVFVLAGVAIVMVVLVGLPLKFLLVIAVGAALIPIVYSYVVYRRLELSH